MFYKIINLFPSSINNWAEYEKVKIKPSVTFSPNTFNCNNINQV